MDRLISYLKSTKLYFLILITSLFIGLASSHAIAKNYYGAIAISPSTKAMGWSYDFGSKWGAQNAAIKKCRKHASDCKVAIWFRNACGAVAIGNNGGWGSAWASSIKKAKWRAKKACRKYDNHCTARRWVCTAR